MKLAEKIISVCVANTIQYKEPMQLSVAAILLIIVKKFPHVVSNILSNNLGST